MQYNLEEYNTIKTYIDKMEVQSHKGFASSENSILLFDSYLIVEIIHGDKWINVVISDNKGNQIHKYSVYDLGKYKPKDKEVVKLIDKRFNQIIELWEKI